MGKPKKKHKKAKQLPLSKEEQIFQAARDLAAEIGISYSEALGFTLGIKDVTYGWEEDYTEEEFQALIDHAVGDTDYEHTLYESSTREERLDYVLNEWRCLHNCELCGKCHILKGRSEEILYADYIDGKRSYMDITLEIRSNR